MEYTIKHSDKKITLELDKEFMSDLFYEVELTDAVLNAEKTPNNENIRLLYQILLDALTTKNKGQ